MATLIDNPPIVSGGPIDIPWTANEVYKISGDDDVEGAQVGASFGGLGVDNQPHQQLADRTSALYNAIQGFAFAFAGVNRDAGDTQGADRGYVKMPAVWTVNGVTDNVWPLIVQWDTVNFDVFHGVFTQTPNHTKSWLIEFPNSLFAVFVTRVRQETNSAKFRNTDIVPVMGQCTRLQGVFSVEIDTSTVDPSDSPIHFRYSYLAIGR